MEYINGLIILTSVTLAFIQFVNGGQTNLIEESRQHFRNLNYPTEGLQELKKARDNFLNGNDENLNNCSTKPYIYTLIGLLLSYPLVSIGIIILPEKHQFIKILLIALYASITIIYGFVIHWLIKIEKQKTYIMSLRKEHEDILMGYNQGNK